MRGNPRLRTSSLQVTPKQLINQELTHVNPNIKSNNLDAIPVAKSLLSDEMAVPGFRILAMGAVPAAACLRPEVKVWWLETECGGCAQFEGADRLYQLPLSVVIAVVRVKARLTLFDGEHHIEVPTGIWRISPEF